MSYLYLPETLERIRRFNPDARFIALVRNPLAMLPSYHLRMRFLLQEDEPDFGRAWALEPARARGERVPRHCLDARLLRYSQVAMLGAQIERLFAVAGRDRSHVVVFDDLVADPLGVYRRALDFLGVDYDGQTQFERRYESQMYRYRWLQRMLFVPATRGGKMIDTLQRRGRKYNQDGSKRPEPDQARDGLEQDPRGAGAAHAGDGRHRARDARPRRREAWPAARPRPLLLARRLTGPPRAAFACAGRAV